MVESELKIGTIFRQAFYFLLNFAALDIVLQFFLLFPEFAKCFSVRFNGLLVGGQVFDCGLQFYV